MSAGGESRRTAVRTVAASLATVAAGVVVALLWRAPDPDGKVEPPVDLPVESVDRPEPFDVMPPGGGPESDPRRREGSEPLWHVVDEGSVRVTPPYSESWSEAGRVLVDVTVAASGVDGWRVGDRLAFELPQLGGIHEWTVERIDEGRDGRSRSVRGWIDNGGDRPRRIVVTVGPGRVLAYIDTPQGPYELTGNARLAWLLPSSSMMAGIDFSVPDYILPDEPESTPPERPEGDLELP